VIGPDSSYSLLACLTSQRKGAGPGLEPILWERSLEIWKTWMGCRGEKEG